MNAILIFISFCNGDEEMKSIFLEMIDVVELNDLMQKFYVATGIPCGVLDMDGNLIVTVGKKSICMEFHRKNPISLKRCQKSDDALFSSLPKDKPYKYHQCANGLIDVAAPLNVAGQQVGIIVLGQFFFEEPDIDFFTKQAEMFGFPYEQYMNALKQVPILSKEKVDRIMDYYIQFGEVLAVLASGRARYLEVQKLARMDGLTGVANRRYLDEYLEQEINAGIRRNEKLSLLLLDVDWFKQYNDTHGHLYGDDCLKVIASVLMSGVKRSSDLVARYGGEEFAIVMPNTESQGALLVAERIKEKIAAVKLEHQTSPFNYVSLSMGLATVTLKRTTKSMQLIEAADNALYLAKENGRNRIERVEI